MLNRLHITNIILIDTAEMCFGRGLNVLSGETGSGKSAIMNALSLILGERAETGMIRRGCDKGSVEASLEIEGIPALAHQLEEAGIHHEAGDELIIRRDISMAGKSRAFINNQAVQLTLLRQLGDYLFKIIGQHATQWLLSVEKHREIVDMFGDLGKDVSAFSKSWSEENLNRKELETLINQEAQRLREIEVCRMELDELIEASLKDGEDDDLFAEYTLLSNAQDRTEKAHQITQTLSGERVSIIASLNRDKTVFEQLIQIDPSLTDAYRAYKSSLLELQEIAYTLHAYRSKIESSPARTSEVNERLTLITRLKRKYGSTMGEIQGYMDALSNKLSVLENADVRIEELQLGLSILEAANNKRSQDLTKKREASAKKLGEAIVTQLRSLNMPKVEFRVKITPQRRTGKGDDAIEFYLVPNIGEHEIPIKECASGGELSRLMLAIQSLLAGKEYTPTLVFDEIDANIGGETAVIVGEKLKEIGEKHQVLCITHFAQVARQAHHHFQISKREESGRTLTLVMSLKDGEKEAELARMLGESALKK